MQEEIDLLKSKLRFLDVSPSSPDHSRVQSHLLSLLSSSLPPSSLSDAEQIRVVFPGVDAVTVIRRRELKWSDVCSEACVLFGKDPKAVIVALVDDRGRTVLVPQDKRMGGSSGGREDFGAAARDFGGNRDYEEGNSTKQGTGSGKGGNGTGAGRNVGVSRDSGDVPRDQFSGSSMGDSGNEDRGNRNLGKGRSSVNQNFLINNSGSNLRVAKNDARSTTFPQTQDRWLGNSINTNEIIKIKIVDKPIKISCVVNPPPPPGLNRPNVGGTTETPKDKNTSNKLGMDAERDSVVDLLLFVMLFLLLAVGLSDPTDPGVVLRYFEKGLLDSGTKPFASTRSGQPITSAFAVNASTTTEIWDWLNGPLRDLLVTSPGVLEQITPMLQSDMITWWGATNKDTCVTPKSIALSSLQSCAIVFDSCPAVKTYNATSRWMISNGNAEVLGSVRFRQLRVLESSCMVRPNAQTMFGTTCETDYSTAVMDTKKFGSSPSTCGFAWYPGSKLRDAGGSETLFGPLGLLIDSSGFVLDLTLPEKYDCAMAYLNKYGWIDARTRAVVVEFSVRNPNANYYASVRGIVEKTKLGIIASNWQVNAYSTPSKLSARFICDWVGFALSLIILLNVLLGGFFTRRRGGWKIKEFFDFCFVVLFWVSLALDMGIHYHHETFNAASTGDYATLDDALNEIRAADRYRAVLIVLFTFRFISRRTFTISKSVTVLFTQTTILYFTLCILSLPFLSAVALLVMVNNQGSAQDPVTFETAIFDILLLITGNQAQYKPMDIIGGTRDSYVAFYLFLLTLTWVLFVPTLIAFSVFLYRVQTILAVDHGQLYDVEDVTTASSPIVALFARVVNWSEIALNGLVRAGRRVVRVMQRRGEDEAEVAGAGAMRKSGTSQSSTGRHFSVDQSGSTDVTAAKVTQSGG